MSFHLHAPLMTSMTCIPVSFRTTHKISQYHLMGRIIKHMMQHKTYLSPSWKLTFLTTCINIYEYYSNRHQRSKTSVSQFGFQAGITFKILWDFLLTVDWLSLERHSKRLWPCTWESYNHNASVCINSKIQWNLPKRLRKKFKQVFINMIVISSPTRSSPSSKVSRHNVITLV